MSLWNTKLLCNEMVAGNALERSISVAFHSEKGIVGTIQSLAGSPHVNDNRSAIIIARPTRKMRDSLAPAALKTRRRHDWKDPIGINEVEVNTFFNWSVDTH